jgi:hypothetical protein
MIEAGTSKPAPFDVVVVHSFSRFFRDYFELEFYVRKLAKNGVKLVSITQEMGDDPMHVMMRQIMALFDEYQSKENAKHVMRALKENARQGFWNGSLAPIGYRTVAAEQRGAKTKKKLEIDLLHADTVWLIYRLALEGDGTSGQMSTKSKRIKPLTDAEEIRAGARSLRGVLSVGVPPAFGAHHLVPAVREFTAVHPEINISLLLDDGNLDLVRDGLDISLRIAPELKDASYVSRVLAQVPQCLVASPDYLCQRRSKTRPLGRSNSRPVRARQRSLAKRAFQ